MFFGLMLTLTGLALLHFMRPSTAAFFISVFIATSGFGATSSISPYVLLRILKAKLGMEKKDCSGTLAALSMLGVQTGALIGAPISSRAFDHGGLQAVIMYLFVAVPVLSIPSIYAVVSYMEPPTHGCLAKHADDFKGS